MAAKAGVGCAGDYAQLVAGGAVAAALWAPIGLAVGALLRNQIAALVGLLAWVLFVESLLFGVLPDTGRFLRASPAARSPA